MHSPEPYADILRLPCARGVRLALCSIAEVAERSGRRQAEQAAVARLSDYFFGPDAEYIHRPDGSPAVVGSRLHISVSHSASYAVMAVSEQSGIGVDIEQSRPRQLSRVSRRFLSADEQRRYTTPEALLWAWAAKEAVYKAAGVAGLSGPEISLPDPFGDEATTATARFTLSTIFTAAYCCVTAINTNNTSEMVKFPKPLKQGDKIAIVSPAGRINPEKVSGAVEVLKAEGWEPVVMPHALGESGIYSGTAQERYSDLEAAFADPDIRAILCSRGGYGVVHIMDRLNRLDLTSDPKWVIGFSDISALHALMASKGVASIHSPMAGQIMLGTDDPDTASLFAILRGERPVYTFPAHEYDRQGIATGKLIGGNVAVLADLIDTPYDVFEPGTILFIEDVAEPIYKIERILYQLRLNGVLPRLGGLIVGQFTDYKPDASYSDMYDMIRDMTAPYKYPVAFNVPVGHVDHNIPLIESADITLKVSPSGTNSIIFHR